MFKVKDKVRVFRPKTEKERGKHPSWTKMMDCLDRQVGIIVEVLPGYEEFPLIYEIKFPHNNYSCCFHTDWIKKFKKNIG